MSSLPSIKSNCTTFIRPLKPEYNEPPLKLNIIHGKREFKVTLRLADNENGARISMRHLAEVILQQTGIIPKEQKFCFRGMTWQNPDLGPWSPALRELGLKNRDRVQMVVYHNAVPDWEAVRKQAEMEKEYTKISADIHALFGRLHGIHAGFYGGGNQLMALTHVRQSLDVAKENLMVLIKDLNAVDVDHRNYEGQAKRRDILSQAQRQVDKCVYASASIFHKLAQSQQLSLNGRQYAGDPLLTGGRSWKRTL